MKTALLIFVALLVVPQAGAGHYSKEGLAFDYPAGWTLGDTSNAELQRVVLTRAGGGSNIIMVFAQRGLINNTAQLNASRRDVTMPYVENIAHKLGLNNPPPPDEAQCVAVGERQAVGFRMTGQLEGEPTTAEVYTVVLGQRLLHLVNVRAEKDETAGADAWKTLLGTLKVEAPAQPSPEADKIEQIIPGGVLNRKAVKKPAPEYPSVAKGVRASGTVTVYIVVDEKGNVESASAVSGHTLLQPPSVEAARRAKFKPTTICGHPVKVSGVVTYNYVLM
ncbi:MAG TPA: energy transducer TonB [Pyrinomonadaceae bacterium]|jgi:TonB family protein